MVAEGLKPIPANLNTNSRHNKNTTGPADTAINLNSQALLEVGSLVLLSCLVILTMAAECNRAMRLKASGMVAG